MIQRIPAFLAASIFGIYVFCFPFLSTSPQITWGIVTTLILVVFIIYFFIRFLLSSQKSFYVYQIFACLLYIFAILFLNIIVFFLGSYAE